MVNIVLHELTQETSLQVLIQHINVHLLFYPSSGIFFSEVISLNLCGMAFYYLLVFLARLFQNRYLLI